MSFKNGFCEVVERKASYAAGFEAHVRRIYYDELFGTVAQKPRCEVFGHRFANHYTHPRRCYRYERFCYADADAIVSPQSVAQPPEVYFK